VSETIGVLVHAEPGPGVLHQLTGAIARCRGDIALVEIIENRLPEARIYFEIDLPGPPEELIGEFRKLPWCGKPSW
jgi:energy-converting hydrogenase B subunit Q